MQQTSNKIESISKPIELSKYGTPSERILKDGCTVIKDVISLQQIEQAKVAVERRFNDYIAMAGGYEGMQVGTPQGYQEIVQRAPGRFDVRMDPQDVPLLGWMTGQSDADHWHDTMNKLLGIPTKVMFWGAFVAMPGSKVHPWHTDGAHLYDHLEDSPKQHLPPYAINLFVPLTQQTSQSGRLKVCVGSHKLTAGFTGFTTPNQENKRKLAFNQLPTIVEADLGDLILSEYRLLHQVEANASDQPRIVLYVSCSASWFADGISFPERSLFD